MSLKASAKALLQTSFSIASPVFGILNRFHTFSTFLSCLALIFDLFFCLIKKKSQPSQEGRVFSSPQNYYSSSTRHQVNEQSGGKHQHHLPLFLAFFIYINCVMHTLTSPSYDTMCLKMLWRSEVVL